MITIFGKAGGEYEAKLQRERFDKVFFGEKRFAWLPTRLRQGNYIWLQTFWRYHSAGLSHDRSYIRLFLTSEHSWCGYSDYLDQDIAHVDCYYGDKRMDFKEITDALALSPISK